MFIGGSFKLKSNSSSVNIDERSKEKKENLEDIFGGKSYQIKK